MVNSIWFEAYFRVSKHLGCKVSEVIKNKFNADYRVLIMRYYMEIKSEIKQAEERTKWMHDLLESLKDIK
jgi:hypothetical protein